MIKPISRILNLLLLLVLIGTCGSTVYFIQTEPSAPVVPIPAFTPTSVPAVVPISDPNVFPATEITPDTNWSVLRRGLERRVVNIYNAQNQQVESLYIWRLDQKYFRLDVGISETPKSLETWQTETNALLVMNGGYFRVENERYFPNGLTVVNGQSFGNSYHGYGGMLAINQDRAELRWLVDRPYAPYEQFQAALQSFPILVAPGGQLGFGPEREDNKPARRTVIAQDKDGRILFMVAPQGYFTLHRLSAYLTESDLNLDIAINLDGGGSTGILVANPHEIISPRTGLPFVILAYPR